MVVFKAEFIHKDGTESSISRLINKMGFRKKHALELARRNGLKEAEQYQLYDLEGYLSILKILYKDLIIIF